MSGIINDCFIDSSILIEYIKGTQTELLELIFASKTDNYINHIVYCKNFSLYLLYWSLERMDFPFW